MLGLDANGIIVIQGICEGGEELELNIDTVPKRHKRNNVKPIGED